MNRELSIVAAACILLCTVPAFALSTDDLLRLKRAGIPEETIVLVVQSGYGDVDKVLALKDAGFRDENIRAIITAESGTTTPGPPAARSVASAAARARIVRYVVFRGERVLQNSQDIEKGVLSLSGDGILTLAWKEQGGLGLLDAVARKPIRSPFSWKINPGKDVLLPATEGFQYVLRSGTDHQSPPETGKDQYWLLLFDAEDPGLVQAIKQRL